MLDSTRDSDSTAERSDAPAVGKKEWQAPACEFLGDARMLTESAGVMAPDGPASSSIS
jgi:hypothetical protein